MEDLMTAPEVAEKLGLALNTVYVLARAGRIPCVRLGRVVRFRASEIEAALSSSGSGAEAA